MTERGAKDNQKIARWEILALAGIGLLGAVLRLSYLLEIIDTPEFRFPPVDAGYHDYWARGLATGDWSLPPMADGIDPKIQTSPYLRPPGYPFFLAAVYAIFGTGYLWPRVIQMMIGLLNVVLGFFLGRAIFGRAVGLLFAGFMSLYWIHIYYEAQLHSPVLLVFLSLVFFSITLRQCRRFSPVGFAAAGFAIGIFALMGPNVLLFVPLVWLWLYWLKRRSATPGRYGASALAFTLATAAVVLPAVLRNVLVADAPVLSANAGINLYIGNNERATGFFVPNLPEVGRFDDCFDFPVVVSRLRQKLGKEVDYADASRYWTDKALSYARDNPAGFTKLLLKKAYLFWSPHEISNYTAVHFNRLYSPTLSRIPGDFAAALSFGLFGLYLLIRRIRAHGTSGFRDPAIQILCLMGLFAAGYFVSFVPFFVTAIYRVPIIWVLLLLSAFGICAAVRIAREKRFKEICTGSLVLAGLIVLTRIPFVDYRPEISRMYFDRGVALVYAGRDQEAIEQFTKAAQAEPGHLEANFNLASALIRLGNVSAGIAHYEKVLAANPGYAPANNNLGAVYMDRGQIPEAVAHFQKALSQEPLNVQALTNLGLCLARQGKLEQAVAYFELAMDQPGADEKALGNDLGNALFLLGRLEESIHTLKSTLVLDPDSPETLNNLGRVLMKAGKRSDAIGHFKRALDINPADPVARANLNRALSPAE